MGLFDRKKEEKSMPEPPAQESSSFPEPPSESLSSVKERVEEAPMPSYEEEEVVASEPEDDVLEEELEDASEELMQEPEPVIPEPIMPTTISPTLYLKLTEYKEVVEATNKMRKDIEKAKQIVSELRMIEKDEHSKLEKSEELIKDIDRIIALFEKTMVTPIE